MSNDRIELALNTHLVVSDELQLPLKLHKLAFERMQTWHASHGTCVGGRGGRNLPEAA